MRVDEEAHPLGPGEFVYIAAGASHGLEAWVEPVLNVDVSRRPGDYLHLSRSSRGAEPVTNLRRLEYFLAASAAPRAAHLGRGRASLEVPGLNPEDVRVVLQSTSPRARARRPYENDCIGVFTIRDGRIQSVRESMDTRYAARWRPDEPGADEQYRPPMLPDALTSPADEIAESSAPGQTLAVAESFAGG